MKYLKLLFVISIVLGACSSLENRSTKVVVDNPDYLHHSVRQVTEVIVHDIFSPPVASRIYAYMSIAAYEAAIHMDNRYRTLAGQLNGLEPFPQPEPNQEYSFPLASVQAVLKVGRTLIFSEAMLDEYTTKVMTDFENAGLDEEVVARSIDFGNKIADHVLAWSGGDQYKQSRSYPKYTIEQDPATWKPTPPAYFDAVEPHWNKIRTFAIDSAKQFAPNPPTPFSTEKKSQFFKEAMEVYETTRNLSEEQKLIANFWDCNPFMMNVRGHVMYATKKISPGGHWMNITHVACKKANADFAQTAEAYVRVSIALVDGFISCWDEKYRSRVIRPETYINQYIDEAWMPLLQTPPFPEYTSGHSVISTASAVTLTNLFGDNFSFIDSTEVRFGLPVRNFNSFNEAASEAAISRLYGGIHYRPAIEQGVVEGKALGEYILSKIKTRKEESLADAK